MSDPLRDAVAFLVDVAIATRDALAESLRNDSQDKALRQRIEDFNAGTGEYADGGWFPHTSTAALIDLMVPRSGTGKLDKAFQRANRLAISSPAAAHILPKLEAVHRTSRELIDAARSKAKKLDRMLPPIDEHCDAVNELALAFSLYDPASDPTEEPDIDATIIEWLALYEARKPRLNMGALHKFVRVKDGGSPGRVEIPALFGMPKEHRTRFIELSESLAREVELRGFASTPYFDLIASVDESPLALWKAAWSLTKRLQAAGSLPAVQSPDSGGEEEDLPALSEGAATLYEILCALPAYRGLTGPKILDALDDKGITIDQSTLTKRIIPELKPYGIENKSRIGYRIPESRRLSHDAPHKRP